MCTHDIEIEPASASEFSEKADDSSVSKVLAFGPSDLHLILGPKKGRCRAVV